MGGKKVIHMDACSNVFEPCCVGKFKPGTGSGPFPSLKDVALADSTSPKPCVHWARLIGLNCHLHFPSVLLLLSLLVTMYCSAYFTLNTWIPNSYSLTVVTEHLQTITWSSQTHLCAVGKFIITPKPAGKRPKLHIRWQPMPPMAEEEACRGQAREDSPTLKTGPLNEAR